MKKTPTGHDAQALCPNCHADLTDNLMLIIKAGTHTYGTVFFCPHCNQPTPWKFLWAMVFDGFEVIKPNEPGPDFDAPSVRTGPSLF
jgi:hypothetical protein